MKNSSILWVVEKLVEESTKLRGNPKPERCGGYLTVLVRGEPQISLCSVVGYFGEGDDNPEQYLIYSQEKAERLRKWWHQHRSSWQSRDPDQGRYGGAISADQRIISFSGLPELVDEAVVTAAAYWLGWLSYESVLTIMEASMNLFIPELIARIVNWPSVEEFEIFPS